MTDTEIIREAAAMLDQGARALTEEQTDFLAFLLRSIANDRRPDDIKYRAAQFARAIGAVDGPEGDQLAQDLVLIDRTLQRSDPLHGPVGLRQAFGLPELARRDSTYNAVVARLVAVLRYWGVCPDPTPTSFVIASHVVVREWDLREGWRFDK